MEVKQFLPITSSKVDDITNGDNVIIPSLSMEEKDKTDGEEKMMEERAGIAMSRSASSNERRQQAKKRGALSLFRAMFMSFSGSASMKKRAAAAAAMGDQKKADEDDSDRTAASAVVTRSSSDITSWKNLVDGMRPLRLHGQLEYYPPPPPLGHDVYHDVILPPPSPERAEGMTSRYSSAQDLQELVNGHEKEDEEHKNSPATEDGGCSPNAIDMQAEVFIAKFYEQFRLQKSDSFNNRTD